MTIISSHLIFIKYDSKQSVSGHITLNIVNETISVFQSKFIKFLSFSEINANMRGYFAVEDRSIESP